MSIRNNKLKDSEISRNKLADNAEISNNEMDNSKISNNDFTTKKKTSVYKTIGIVIGIVAGLFSIIVGVIELYKFFDIIYG